jgi:hypothetical protein
MGHTAASIVPARFRRRVVGRPFEPGREKTGGRKKGVRNISTNDVKEAIVTALTQVGEDGHGHDGLVGYCRGLILRDHDFLRPSISQLTDVCKIAVTPPSQSASTIRLPLRFTRKTMDRIKTVLAILRPSIIRVQPSRVPR